MLLMSIYIYKSDYKQLFLLSNMYQLIDEKIYNCDKVNEKITTFNRSSVSLLEKNSTEFYEIVK